MNGYYLITLTALTGVVTTFFIIYYILLRRRLRCHASWTLLSANLKARCSQAGALIEIVTAIAAHEKALLAEAERTRQAVLAASVIADQANANRELAVAVDDLLRLGKIYPSLQSNGNFTKIAEDLTSLDDKIDITCREYNLLTGQFNSILSKIPLKWIGWVMNFHTLGQWTMGNDQ